MFGNWIIGLIALICAVWVILQVSKQKMDSTKKLIWIICAILFSIITAIVYYFVNKK